jgi:hypothetical protein
LKPRCSGLLRLFSCGFLFIFSHRGKPYLPLSIPSQPPVQKGSIRLRGHLRYHQALFSDLDSIRTSTINQIPSLRCYITTPNFRVRSTIRKGTPTPCGTPGDLQAMASRDWPKASSRASVPGAIELEGLYTNLRSDFFHDFLSSAGQSLQISRK